ncbi:hypothetical protein M0R45_030113 [Rubus argutus]|uniref:Uncharacterized protein n=1 Tax=Rubus argutus TaxID=59490 RepID=A0AAW1WA23_RUBAR
MLPLNHSPPATIHNHHVINQLSSAVAFLNQIPNSQKFPSHHLSITTISKPSTTVISSATNQTSNPKSHNQNTSAMEAQKLQSSISHGFNPNPNPKQPTTASSRPEPPPASLPRARAHCPSQQPSHRVLLPATTDATTEVDLSLPPLQAEPSGRAIPLSSTIDHLRRHPSCPAAVPNPPP